MKVYIKPREDYSAPILYVLKVIEKNQNLVFDFIATPENADLIWDDTHSASQFIHVDFYAMLHLDNPGLGHAEVFRKTPEVIAESGEKDTIATIFYMVNCLQEYAPTADQRDQIGRFKYEASYQSRFGNIQDNLVQKEIDAFMARHQLKGSARKSTFFVSHDIDTIYGSFLQDGFWALKKLKIGVILNLIAWEFMRKPHWKNIDKIIKINNEYDVKSTFFWLVNKGLGTQQVKNADYDLRKEQQLTALVDSAGFTNGLHKSCSEMSIDAELEKGQIKSTYNRYHFLNFLPHSSWREISESKLDFDGSLGFAEHFGFRNSYGKAFQPFDFRNRKPFDFVEAPLNFMDGTFHKYMGLPSNTIGDIVIDFYERNATNCDFSLLWHNTYFTNYKYNPFLKEYKKILAYIYESKIDCLNPDELIQENRLAW